MGEIDQEPRRWTVTDAAELYEVANWGKGFFSVNQHGHIAVHPEKDPKRSIDLKRLVDRLRKRGLTPPVLIRFGDVLKYRLEEIHAAFRSAIDDHDYQAEYKCIYPIKVNQQRQVVEEVLHYGRSHRFGLEAGSKPELLAVIALANGDVPIVCNGFKDTRFIETALLAEKIGRKIYLVIEKYTDLERILHCSRQIGVRPDLGVRIKLASPGAGKWQASAGYRSKFGLTVAEVLQVLDDLKRDQMEDCLKLLHFHLGSQVTNIRHIKAALNEAARIYIDLVRHGAGLKVLDVGGGLGVDYDGSRTNFDSSINYTLQEYANDVVFHVQSVCDDARVEHPTLFSESGRAVVAYHSILVFNVLGVSGQGDPDVPHTLQPDVEQPLVDLFDTYHDMTIRNLRESYHDALQALDMAMNLFGAGYLPLQQRSLAENLFWAICHKIRRMQARLEYVPEELEKLDVMLGETYFCNFSLFQSMPDSWAIKQIFPVMPIHRLEHRPTHQAVLADITCDSDGKIDRFIDRRDVKRTLPLHDFDERPYYLGAFLVGAYQEILGDLHNLFGDTNAVHVRMETNGDVSCSEVIGGDTVREVLEYVAFDAKNLMAKLQSAVESAILDGRIDDRQAGQLLQFFSANLEDLTYMEG